MTRQYFVRAAWDSDAGVLVATSDDVPGLVTEADTLKALNSKLNVMVPELLEAIGCLRYDQTITYKLDCGREVDGPVQKKVNPNVINP